MKQFFQKLWAAIKKPLCYAAIILLAGLFLFCVIDAVIRCFRAQIFYGIVQLLMCAAAFPVFYLIALSLIEEAKGAPKSE